MNYRCEGSPYNRPDLRRTHSSWTEGVNWTSTTARSQIVQTTEKVPSQVRHQSGTHSIEVGDLVETNSLPRGRLLFTARFWPIGRQRTVQSRAEPNISSLGSGCRPDRGPSAAQDALGAARRGPASPSSGDLERPSRCTRDIGRVLAGWCQRKERNINRGR